MSDPSTTARTARESLARGLRALQDDPNVPAHLLDLAEPIAQAMGALFRIERSKNGVLAADADDASKNVRTALSKLQTQPSPTGPVVEAMVAVAESLGLVHALTLQARRGGASDTEPAPTGAAPAKLYEEALAKVTPVIAPKVEAPPVPVDAPVFSAGGTLVDKQFPRELLDAPPPAPEPPRASAKGAVQRTAKMPPAAGPASKARKGAPSAAKPPPAPAAEGLFQPPAVPPARAVLPPTTPPARAEVAAAQPAAQAQPAPAEAAPPAPVQPAPIAARPPKPPPSTPRMPPPRPPEGADLPRFEAALGTATHTNFYRGLGGNDVVEHGGIFVETYRSPKAGTHVQLKVVLPGGYEFAAKAYVVWQRLGSSADAPPGFGARFTEISTDARQLVNRFARNREPLFHDDL